MDDIGALEPAIGLVSVTTPPTQQMSDRIRRSFGHFLHGVELAGLVVLGLATAFAMVQESRKIVLAGEVSLTDLLLMFLYLEVLEMNVRYLRLGRLPVRFPLYIAMASLARDLILHGGTDTPDHVVMTTIGILLLAIGVLILRFGQHRFPMQTDEEDGSAESR
jgi:protein PsiE